MRGRGNSAQSEWLRHPHLSWRAAFPLFAALWDSATALLWHETRLLVLTATAMVAFTFGLVLTLSYFDLNGIAHPWVQSARPWSLAAVAIVAVWTSLGRGDWHLRFPLGLLAAGWLTVAHLAAAHTMGVTRRADIDQITTSAAFTFALSAFGGAWLRSLGRWQLAGPSVENPAAPLRFFQFSTATLFVMMMLTAAALGLWQIAAGLDGLVNLDIRHLDYHEVRGAIVLASVSALAAYVIAFGDLKLALAVTLAFLALLGAADCFADMASGPRIPQFIWTSIPKRAFVSGAISLALALGPLVWLRLAGFHRQRADGARG